MDEILRKYESIKPLMRLKNNMGSEDVHYSIFYEGIPSHFNDIALKELNETDENKRTGVLKLRDYLKGKCISDVEDYILITVLRNCKFNTKKAEKKLIKYLQTHDMITKLLQTADLKKFEIIMKHRIVGFLPYRDKYGRAIGYTTPYDIDFKQYDIDDAGLCCLCISLYLLSFPLTTIAGGVYIAECKSPSLSIFYPLAKGFRSYVPTMLTFPFRASKIEVINEHSVIRWIYKMIKHVISSKVRNRIQFHGSDLQDLHSMYHPAILPEEFGGTLGPINPDFFMDDVLEFIKKLKSKNMYFLQQ